MNCGRKSITDWITDTVTQIDWCNGQRMNEWHHWSHCNLELVYNDAMLSILRVWKRHDSLCKSRNFFLKKLSLFVLYNNRKRHGITSLFSLNKMYFNKKNEHEIIYVSSCPWGVINSIKGASYTARKRHFYDDETLFDIFVVDIVTRSCIHTGACGCAVTVCKIYARLKVSVWWVHDVILENE